MSLDRPSVLAPIPPKAAPPIEYDPARDIDRYTASKRDGPRRALMMEEAAAQDEPVRRRRLPYKLDNDPMRADLMRRMGSSTVTPEWAGKSADHSLRSGLIPPEWWYKTRTRTN